jgi:hypothetical protein
VPRGVLHVAVKEDKLAFTFTEAPPKSSKDQGDSPDSPDPDIEPEAPEPEFVES